ncbi:MAG TPA: ABC transporter ATP-binding protein [Pyrinomonadaceae bacterium]|nr:ABC transporter ATP-binding protein [Pyrinomonadaceae bacterium]
MEPIIRVENLGKQYTIGTRDTAFDTLREALANRIRSPLKGLGRNGNSPDRTIWALRDVSFEVEQGEVVGIIGRNGAGKSTLLKILSRITEPTTGRIRLCGRVGSLLEVGTGFHPELTGRENIYLNGAILGMRRDEIMRKFDEIVAFAEIEKFLDTPVKRYSSGMYVRLAFAVAAHLEPEILIVDEVLAVGDSAFQKKCLGKMGDVARAGRTVLFVSHNMAAVRHLCSQALLIDHGKVAERGNTSTVINKYFAGENLECEGEFLNQEIANDASESNDVRLLRVSVKNRQNAVTNTITTDSPIFIEIEYELRNRLENVRTGFRLIADDGSVVFSSVDTDPGGWGVSREPGVYVSKCKVPGNFLNSGRYFVSVACDLPMQKILFWRENVVSFMVQLTGGAGASVPDGRLGAVRPILHWDVNCIRIPYEPDQGL